MYIYLTKSDKAKCYLVNRGDRYTRVHCTSLATFLKV